MKLNVIAGPSCFEQNTPEAASSACSRNSAFWAARRGPLPLLSRPPATLRMLSHVLHPILHQCGLHHDTEPFVRTSPILFCRFPCQVEIFQSFRATGHVGRAHSEKCDRLEGVLGRSCCRDRDAQACSPASLRFPRQRVRCTSPESTTTISASFFMSLRYPRRCKAVSVSAANRSAQSRSSISPAAITM